MTPFFLMLVVFWALHAPGLRGWPGGPASWEKAAGALGLGLFGSAAMHFLRPDVFVTMVPAGLPSPELIVVVSGIVEFVVGIGLLVSRTRRAAGWASVVLFVAIWPASIYVAFSGTYPTEPTSSPLYHWARVPFHALYVGWALWIARGRLPFFRT